MICCYYYYNNYDYYSYYNPHPYYYVIWIWHGSVVWLCFDCFNPRSPRTTYTRNRVWRTPADIWVVSVPFQPRRSGRVLLWAQQTLLSVVLLTKKKEKKNFCCTASHLLAWKCCTEDCESSSIFAPEGTLLFVQRAFGIFQTFPVPEVSLPA